VSVCGWDDNRVRLKQLLDLRRDRAHNEHMETTTQSTLSAGSLVEMGTIARSNYIAVLHRDHLDADALSGDLADAGWRYAIYSNTGCKVLVRPMEGVKWFAAWDTRTVRVEVAEVETGTRFSEEIDGFAIVTELGKIRPGTARARFDRVES
jgi:hypothetical protein